MKLTDKEKMRLHGRYGTWAVVTGASSGIGLELASLLANAGFNLVMVARRYDQLQGIAKGLKSNLPVEVEVVVADLETPSGYDRVMASTEHLNVGLLVASAGFGTSGFFTQNEIEQELGMLQVNCVALLELTHHFAKRFALQKRGGIILLSSIVAFQGTPYAANYAATKAYVQTLAEGIAIELAPHNVDVLAAAPGPVQTGFADNANMKMDMYLTPDQIGVPILKALGRQTTVFPGLLTKILVYALRTVPRWAKTMIMGKVMGGMTAHQR